MRVKSNLIVYIFIVLTRDCACDNIIDAVLPKVMRELDSAIERLLTGSGQADLDASVQKVDLAAQTEYQKAMVELQSIQKSSYDKIDDLRDMAARKGKNVDICTIADQMKLASLVIGPAEGLVRCLEGVLTKAHRLEHKALHKIRHAAAKIKAIRRKISQCVRDGLTLKCLTEPLLRLAWNAVAVPLEIRADVTSTAANIAKMTANMKKCTSNAVAGVPAEASAVVLKVDVCAAAILIVF